MSVGGLFRAVANAPTPVHMLLVLLAIFAGIAGMIGSFMIYVAEPWYERALIAGLGAGVPVDQSYWQRDHSESVASVFPIHMSRTTATQMLDANGFNCLAQTVALNCERKPRALCARTYTVQVFFDQADAVIGSKATSTIPRCS